jgi:serine/threonine-protein kinase
VTAPPPDLPARLGDYEILGEIGHGPTGYVCLVRAPEGHEFAAKVLHPRYAEDPERCQRFVREALVAKTLTHPHIVRVHRVVPHFDFPLPFYLMDHLTGGNIGRYRGGPTPETLGLLADICDALAYVHSRKLIHFDVKPSNILLGADGTAYLTDFGTTVTAAGGATPGGTLPYMAPEHLAGENADHRADVYSTGVVLYELVVGDLPFTASNPFALQYQIRHAGGPPRTERAAKTPDGVWAVVCRAMAPDPADRFSTAGALGDALRATALQLDPSRPPS